MEDEGVTDDNETMLEEEIAGFDDELTFADDGAIAEDAFTEEDATTDDTATLDDIFAEDDVIEDNCCSEELLSSDELRADDCTLEPAYSSCELNLASSRHSCTVIGSLQEMMNRPDKITL